MSSWIDDIIMDMRDWLGTSFLSQGGWGSIPPSRFEITDKDGLWNYLPYLCGVGLVEGLQLAYNLSMKLW